jgi:hypothetical protein
VFVLIRGSTCCVPQQTATTCQPTWGTWDSTQVRNTLMPGFGIYYDSSSWCSWVYA